MITLSRNRPTRGTGCQRCKIIRFFIMAAVLIAVMAFTIDSSAQYLQMLTSQRAAAAVWIIGGVIFVFKLGAYLLRQRISAGREQAARQAAGTGKTAHKHVL